MKKIVKRAGILIGIFLLTITVYFILAQKNNNNTDVKYTSIEDANLPIMYMEMYGRQMNCLHGYLQEGSLVADRDSLTVLPQDRQLSILLENKEHQVTGIQYEIRSLDGSTLVERTVLTDWQAEGSNVRAVLPIQNLLTKEKEYALSIYLSTEDKPYIGYYTRIMWTDSDYVEQFIALAEDFSSKTFNYDTARELTTYLETEPTADNSSLGNVTLKSSFDQLTWAGLGVQPVGEISVTLKELHGISANVQLDYRVERTNDKGAVEQYEVTENFTMKWNAQRIYMMNYNRDMNQLFGGDKSLYSGKRIMLGITDGRDLQAVSDENENYQAFVVNRELWCLDREQNRSIKVFSFREDQQEDIRGTFDHHNIQILDVTDQGDISFLVYGYMNRGGHEGNVGVSLYTYHGADNSIDEEFFIPVNENFEKLNQDMKQLSFLSSKGMFYMLADHVIYAIDLSSSEYMVVAEALERGSFAVSSDKSRIAWQEGRDPYDCKLIHIMDLETGKKDEISHPEQRIVKVLGFVGNDFVYGLADSGDKLVVNQRMAGLPMYAMEIMGKDMMVQTRYQKEGIYISDVRIDGSRIHLQQLQKSTGNFVKTQEDTLVCNEEIPVDELAGIGWFASNDRRKVYFVTLDKELESNKNIRVQIPKKMQEKVNCTILLKADTQVTGTVFYAYGNGRMLGRFTGFSDAAAAAHDVMGIVTDEKQQILWARADRGNVKNLKDVQTYDRLYQGYLERFTQSANVDEKTLMLDARGCGLNQVLYFVDKGWPVIAYTGIGSYVLIYGYDQYNISVYNPATEETYKMGLNDGAAYFSELGNDFICTLFTD